MIQDGYRDLRVPDDSGRPAREEVARLAGVSVAWDTFSEQGRPLRASEAVLDWLAQVPRMLVTRNLTTPLSAECSSSQ